jgi:hypothetical protein
MERRIEAMQVGAHVEWFDEMSNTMLRKLYQLPNVIVCDQYDSSTGYLGAIGREASMFGCPLISCFEPYNRLFFGNDLPEHVFPARTAADVEAAMHALVSAGSARRRMMRAAAVAWSARNLSPQSLIPKFVDVLARRDHE